MVAGGDSSLSYAWEEVGGSGYRELGTEEFAVRNALATSHCSCERKLPIDESGARSSLVDILTMHSLSIIPAAIFHECLRGDQIHMLSVRVFPDGISTDPIVHMTSAYMYCDEETTKRKQIFSHAQCPCPPRTLRLGSRGYQPDEAKDVTVRAWLRGFHLPLPRRRGFPSLQSEFLGACGGKEPIMTLHPNLQTRYLAPLHHNFPVTQY